MNVAISKDTLLTHIGYSDWATAKVLDACSALSTEELERDLKCSHKSVLSTLHHLFFADRLWLSRLEGGTAVVPSPDESPALDQLQPQWSDIYRRYADWLGSTTDEELHERFHYRNLKGDPMSLIRWQALLHIVNHGSIHRGQVVAMLRQLGQVPPAVDLLYYYLR